MLLPSCRLVVHKQREQLLVLDTCLCCPANFFTLNWPCVAGIFFSSLFLSIASNRKLSRQLWTFDICPGDKLLLRGHCNRLRSLPCCFCSVSLMLMISCICAFCLLRG